ncbi:hypothetical protein PIB30_026078 [Stylosanthes scabra]|uniref:Heparan-alpha-glucosaminide N-acetyltransferase catalytic domain-containing protein n=1 Tax=Stylosanthes scabra TaxID=79078 RepID=A0ABU6YC59_9FABA|nr:hypothetical protein [Stylosanthes scabra]
MENSGYEPVRNYDEKEERLHLNPNMMRTKKDAKENDDVHVEMANFQISESRRASIFANNNKNNERLVSLDIFRGLTVTLMVFVDHAGRLFPGINHSPWNGVTLADFVMPFFLFIVGVSLALTYKRIAIAYLAAALCEIWLKSNDTVNSVLSLLKKYRYQGAVVFFLSIFYLCLLYGLYVPDWEYQISTVKCGVRGDTGPACNAVGMIDRKILGIHHLYKKPIYARKHECSINSPNYGPLPPNAPSWCQAPFDPEGFLSSLMAVVTCFVGLHYGHIIIHFKDQRVRIFQWMSLAFSLVVLGLILDIIGMHINKALYTVSYMCVTSGAAGILFAGIYYMV